ncbi:MAG: hypothetical protein R2764_17940 [Bacteroidales bacterium]
MNVFDYFFEKTSNLSKNLVLGPGETISYKKIYNDSLIASRALKDLVGDKKTLSC